MLKIKIVIYYWKMLIYLKILQLLLLNFTIIPRLKKEKFECNIYHKMNILNVENSIVSRGFDNFSFTLI